jgi:YebC/PmpR family DNA-binding regulatory protein
MGRAYQNRKASMAKTAEAKTRVYSKYAREIYVCARSGGTDPAGNLTLRSLIDRAKKDQVPSHVIERALEKAGGGGGEDFAVARYEGFGPGGCLVIVDCLTDNPNRTFGDVRVCFNKVKAKLGAPGSVGHLFDHCAILSLKADEEQVLETLMNADVEVSDIESEAGHVTVFTPSSEYFKAKQALQDDFADARGELDLEVDAIQFLPQATTVLNGEDLESFEKLVELLSELDDVQNVYHNVDAGLSN